MKVSDENDNQLCYNLVLFFPFYGLEKGYLQEYIYACTQYVPLRFEYTLELKYSRSEGYSETTSCPFKG